MQIAEGEMNLKYMHPVIAGVRARDFLRSAMSYVEGGQDGKEGKYMFSVRRGFLLKRDKRT